MLAATFTHIQHSCQNGNKLLVEFGVAICINVLHFENSLFGHRGWEQLEVTCNPFNEFSGNVLWNVEGNAHSKRECH